MVEWQDIQRLFSEITAMIQDQTPEQTVEGWASGNNIDQDVLMRIAQDAIRLLTITVDLEIPGATKDELITAGVQSLGVMYFMLGWDAHKQYGGGDDRSRDFPS